MDLYFYKKGAVILCLPILIISIITLTFPVSAQIENRVNLSVLYTENFPQLEAFLNIYDSQGDFINNLTTNDVKIIENGIPIELNHLKEIRQGAQIVIAINPGPSFAIRNNEAVSRYDLIIEALNRWAINRIGTTIDDISIINTNGDEITHTSNPLDLKSLFAQEIPDARSAIPVLDTLFRAVSLAADQTPRSGMGKAVLYISPPLEGQNSQSLENLIIQAQQNNVRIFVWIISSAGALNTSSANQLIELATQTGGEYFSYTGAESLPDPDLYFEPLRNSYHLIYNSKVKQSGTHQVIAEVMSSPDKMNTPPQNFDITLHPPKPAFIAPPIQITRHLPASSDSTSKSDFSIEDYDPTEQILEVIYEFPDGRIREIVRTSLYVDGSLENEITEPPFDKITWKIDKYTSENTHLIQLQVEDSFGLVGSSIETPVEFLIEQPEAEAILTFYQNPSILSVLAVVSAGAVLFLVMILGGRLRPKISDLIIKLRMKSDPLTQNVVVKEDPVMYGPPGRPKRFGWVQPKSDTQEYAFLDDLPINGSDDSNSITFPVTTDEVIIGSDPSLATLLIDDPSIEPVHARLIRNENGSFRLLDEESIAGTWINYTPISKQGTGLHHGDLVHFGHIGFRFSLRDPGKIRKPVINLVSTPNESIKEAHK